MKTSFLFLSAGISASIPSTGAEEAQESLPEDISREISEASEAGQPRLFDITERWAEARRKLEKELGFGWTASYHGVALGALGGDGVPVGASGDFTVQGVWAPGHRWTDNPTELRFRLRQRHAYAHTSASELGPEIGALWGVVDGYSNSGFEIPDFYLRHDFERAGIELRYGQMTIDSQFAGHQLASSKKYFLNQAFSANPAVAFPRFGAGLTLVKEFDNGLSIGFGTTTVQGTQSGDQVDLEFGSRDLFQALQFSYKYKGRDDLGRRLLLLGWRSDAVSDALQPEGQGVQFIYERALDEAGTRLFSTLAWAEGGAAPLDYFLAAGIGRPCGEHDFGGLAIGMGRGSDSEHEFQAVFEAFYRWSPRENVQITPDLQLLVGEGFTGGPGIRVVGGVRAALSF